MRKTKLHLVLLTVLCTAVAAEAVPVLPGTSLTKPGVGLVPPNYTSGPLPAAYSVLLDTLISPMIEAIPGITGTITSWVYQNPLDQTLAFQYLFETTPSVPDADLVRASIGDSSFPWAGFAISDAGADGSGSSTGGGGAIQWTDGDPNFLLRDPTIAGEGITIQWRAVSNGTVLRGNNSDFSSLIWFVTNAKNYTTTDVGLIDSGRVSHSSAFAPAAVPEPSTLLLLGLGIAGLLGYSKRKRKA